MLLRQNARIVGILGGCSLGRGVIMVLVGWVLLVLELGGSVGN